jgi:16S rRNA (cytidine1402-2'-O)-methyltransferase
MTLRAIDTLREVSLVAAEDTRTAQVLLNHFGIRRRVVSYHDFTSAERRAELIDRLAEGDLALISEAGTPTLSDPGYQLVRAALAAGYEVRPIPGASALLAALAASGLPTDQFVFLGFLPRKAGDRRRAIEGLASEPRTLVIYESPHRLRRTLEDLGNALGDRPVCLARELTKLHEEFYRGTISEALAHFTEPRGEFTLVVAGAPSPAAPVVEDDAIERRIGELLAAGQAPAAIARALAKEFSLPRRDAYDRVRAWQAASGTALTSS